MANFTNGHTDVLIAEGLVNYSGSMPIPSTSTLTNLTLPDEMTWNDFLDRFNYLEFNCATTTHNNGSRFHKSIIQPGKNIELSKYNERYILVRFDSDFDTGDFGIACSGASLTNFSFRGTK